MTDLSTYEKARKAALAAAEAHEWASIADALTLLNGLRLAIIARMSEVSLTAGDAYAMRRLQMMIDSAIADYLYRAEAQLSAAVWVGIENGLAIVERPMTAIGVVPSFPAIPIASLQAAELFALDRVKGLTAEMRMQISGILRRVHGGTITANQGIAEVGRSLQSGRFKNYSAKASLIVRQEVLTVQSQATQARMEQSAAVMKSAGYELRKGWLSANDARVRKTHEQAQADYYGADAYPGPIMIEQPFMVGDDELMFPRDPAGSLEEIMNCRCSSVPVVMRIAA